MRRVAGSPCALNALSAAEMHSWAFGSYAEQLLFPGLFGVTQVQPRSTYLLPGHRKAESTDNIETNLPRRCRLGMWDTTPAGPQPPMGSDQPKLSVEFWFLGLYLTAKLEFEIDLPEPSIPEPHGPDAKPRFWDSGTIGVGRITSSLLLCVYR